MLPYIHVPINVPNVPFYSQFEDIQPLEWQKKSCGIASLGMVIEFYKPETVSVNKLLAQAIAAGAYQKDAGWKHKDLALLAESYGLDGNTYDLSKLSAITAFNQFKTFLKDGPVIASIYYKFDPKSPIPHLIVIDGISDNIIYYNDPSSNSGVKNISIAGFIKGWKKRFIVIRPKEDGIDLAGLPQ